MERLFSEKNAKKVLNENSLCDNCLGRLFHKKNDIISNKEKARIIRKKFRKKEVKTRNCSLCNGLLDEIDKFVNLINDKLKEYEFDNFLIGCKIDEDIVKREKKLNDFIGFEKPDLLKNEINREIGKKLEEKLGKLVSFEKPTIMVILDTQFDFVDLQIASLFIYGRYNKYSREIPQTRWFCKICRGKGCRKCNYSGKIYDKSVQELVSKIILKETKGNAESFHGAGREDVDVQMLGSGRPFVVEINNPKKRNIDLEKIQEKINKENKGLVEVTKLRFSERKEVARIKNAKFSKVYKVEFKCDKPINNEKLKKVISSLQGTKIGQLTPSRVAHRRANMVREKHIHKCQIVSIEDSIATLTLETESGTYIKELVSGDDGRTKPSISGLIGTPCKVTKLDVIEIKGE